MHTHNEKRGRDTQAGKVEYAEQVLVLEYLYIAAHTYGEPYHNWMIPWMIYNPYDSLKMLRDYYVTIRNDLCRTLKHIK